MAVMLFCFLGTASHAGRIMAGEMRRDPGGRWEEQHQRTQQVIAQIANCPYSSYEPFGPRGVAVINDTWPLLGSVLPLILYSSSHV